MDNYEELIETQENEGKFFSTLKMFTFISILSSIALLFMPWFGDISPMNLATFKNDMFDILRVDLPLTLNLFFYLGYITILFLVFSLIKVYNSDYRSANLLQFLNIVVLVVIIASNIFHSANGAYEDWWDDEVKKKYSRKFERKFERKSERCMGDYGIDIEKDEWALKAIKFTPFLFVIIFLVNWILIGRLSRRKRLNAE